MTVVVAFYCSDGVVIAADSMLTPSIGGISVGHHKGIKVELLAGDQLFAFAGDQGQAARFKIMADGNHAAIATSPHPMDYALALTTAMIAQFNNTGVGNNVAVNTLLAFEHAGQINCCVYEGALQPRLLDSSHFYTALGSGKMSADPFLRFVVDVFCQAGQPSVRDAVFLSCWVVEHVIATNPGGVAGPIRIGVLERAPAGVVSGRILTLDEIAEHQQAIESAAVALRGWRDGLISPGVQAVPPPPVVPLV